MTAEAELIRTIDISGFPSNEAYPADIDGDGRMEILFLQAPGISQSDAFDGSGREVSLVM